MEANIDRISELDEKYTTFMIEINSSDFWIVTK
jgi:hypothetical protein